jgi:hypothetical protein|tara:strand:+ start:132 stop:896 length:765 start_codon:yes stop_codon:yes gene_type:complete
MAFKMKNPSIAKMVKMAGNSRTMAKMKMEAAAKMKKKASMAKQETADEEVKRVSKGQTDFEKRKREKIEKLQKEVKDKVNKYNTSMDSISNVNKNYKTQQEKDYESMSASEYRKKYPTTNKMKKDDSMAKMKEPMKMKEEGAMKMKKPMKMKEEESMAKMKKPMKMKKDDSMAKKALVGKQKNLPPELKAKIEAAPGKLKKKTIAKQKDAEKIKVKTAKAPKAPKPTVFSTGYSKIINEPPKMPRKEKIKIKKI